MSELYPFSVVQPEGKVIGAVAHDVAARAPGAISDVSRAVYALDRIAASGTDGPDVTVVPGDNQSRIRGITFHQPDQLLHSEQLLDIRAIGQKSLKVLHEFANAATQSAVSIEQPVPES